MNRTFFSFVAVMVLLDIFATCGTAADSYQPKSHVTRGIYARIDQAVGTSVWTAWGSGFEFVDHDPHGGRACVRCVGRAGLPGQGVSQRIELKQTKPHPVKIAGWSRAKNVAGKSPSYHYSLYVDFTFTDGTSWPMKLATFEPGTHGWQYRETIVTPPKPLQSAAFHAFIREVGGTVWFDDLFFGEVNGPNRLRCPGFEPGERTDASAAQILLDDLDSLHCNALHGYLGSTLTAWDEGPSEKSELAAFLAKAGRRGIGVWLTLGLGPLPIRDANDPNFPQYDCVNGPWGKRWTEALEKAARFPFAGLSMVPDEFNWNNGRLKRAYKKHPDPKVRQFYAKMETYCNCPVCRKTFDTRYGGPFPTHLPSILPSADATYRKWLRFRYDSTTDWIRRSCAAVKRVNPALRTDSLICVTPICTDFWYGPGIAWDRAGYEAHLEYATTDPYILLHNYLGDSTHWYVTETTEHLAAASPQRRCGVVLEASRLRREYRELDPVEIYGSALSAVWHGADELAWWHYTHVMGISGTTSRADVSRACVAGVYSLMEKIDPWLDRVTPSPGIALLFSRASCDAWRLYVQAKDSPIPFATHGISDPRYGALIQKELLYLLFRTGTPATLYYLDSVRQNELVEQHTILVPFPLAVSEKQAELLARLAQSGKHVVIFGTDGPLDEDSNALPSPALASLVGSAVSRQRVSETKIGDGRVTFVPHTVLERLIASRDNEHRSRLKRVLPSRLDPSIAKMILGIVSDRRSASVARPLLGGRLPEGDDVEVCLSTNARGDNLLLVVNWNQQPRTLRLPTSPRFDKKIAEAYRLLSTGKWSRWQGTLQKTMQLEPQEARVVRF